jgi:hypothetical protein
VADYWPVNLKFSAIYSLRSFTAKKGWVLGIEILIVDACVSHTTGIEMM